MTPQEALARVHEAGRSGIFSVHPHAETRMEQRNVSMKDIRYALRVATHVLPYKFDWRVPSVDVDGDELTLGVEINGGIVVITVF